jgi:putative ABC transport system permease protein
MVMNRSIYKLIFRKMRGHLSQLLGMGLLVIVGVAFFITLTTIYRSYEENAEHLFKTQNYAEVTFYGSFADSDVEKVLEQGGIDQAQGRFVQDYKDGEVTLRVISLTNSINDPYLYEGTFPQTSVECLILKKHAVARQIEIGDRLIVDEHELIVKGIVASPEYIYLVQNDRAMMAQGERFGVVFVLADYFDGFINEIVATGNIETAAADKIGNVIGATRSVLRADQLNYNLYQDDLNQIRTFAYIFPLIFALLIVMIVYVMLKRTIAKEQRQIGVFKALGVEGSEIIFIYVAQAGIIALVSAILGCFVAMLLCDTIIGFFSAMFEVPGLSFILYPFQWAGMVLLSLAICMLSALVSIWHVLKPLPAQLLRVRMPSGGRKLLLERITFIWRRLSFHTRYSLKSTFRNKGRFLAVTLGMCGSCALLTFSFGFFNSAEHTQSVYFKEFARYDVLMEFDVTPLAVEHPVIKYLDRINKALMMPVIIDDEEYRLVIVESDFDMQKIETKKLENGVILPEYYAEKWHVSVGDMLKISDVDTKVVGVSAQNFGLSLYTSYHYADEVFPDFPPVYNVLFAENEDLQKLEAWSKEFGFEYSTLEDDKMSLNSVMESLNTLIWFMLVCAVILGVTVLYSVGLINLSAREYEYMFMGVMGYPLKSIMYSHIKEAILQLIIAIPSGLLLGYGILNIVKGAFSSDNFVLMAAIYRQSYVLSGTIVVVMVAFIALISMRYIDRLDIVGGLKASDE